MKIKNLVLPLTAALATMGLVSCGASHGTSHVTTYTVTFYSLGGSSVPNQNITSGSKITNVTPTREGYTFSGWYTDITCITPYNADNAVNENLELYAKWTENSGEAGGGQTGGGQTGGGETGGGETGGGQTGGGETGGGETGGGTTTGGGVAPNPEASPEGSGTVETRGTLAVLSCSGEVESAYVEFEASQAYDDYNVYISAAGANNFKKLANGRDYYINETPTFSRLDVSGLPKGDYDIKISEAKDGNDVNNPTIVNVSVTEYDRSGYAHFSRKSSETAYTGVGAYNDDGTLKENAIVLYVTDANKNTVELTYKGKTVKGIGNILNTVGKASGDAGHENQCRKVDQGKYYYAAGNTNQGILNDLAKDNVPLAIRMVGLISESKLYKSATYDATDAGAIDGLTSYANANTINADGTAVSKNNDFADFGGTKGDNGHMARMKSAKNVTIEGIGNDAGLDGWGVHFMAESADKEAGKSFEVRNLVFMNTPEDAIGMEGIQESGKITASVERCWIHHNTFLAPSIGNPAESDKAQGDGSCDFKRGMYYTLAYNYFEYCHKTNLIGSSDSSLQYNISFHHNLWYNCGSRIPLLRQANIHFYNNFVYGDSNDSEAELSYVSSLRANSYMYSEFNYYEGCKAVTVDTGGAAKLYGNAMVQCFNGNTGSIVKSRTAEVASKCAYDGKSYANFDTKKDLFYYNDKTYQSDCYLTSAERARTEDIKLSGSKYRTVLNKTALKTTEVAFNPSTPTNAVSLDGTNLLPTSKTSGEVNGVIWGSDKNNSIQGYSSTTGVKFRGKAATFKVDKYATVNIVMSGTSSSAVNDGALIAEDGRVVLVGSGSKELAPGIYTLVSCQKDKDTNITSLSFTEYDASALKEQLISEYNAAYQAIPGTIAYTAECLEKINAAVKAYNELGKYQSEVTTNPNAKLAEYVALGKTRVEDLISAIGTVTKNSGTAIQSARNAYNGLVAVDSSVVISNYSVLEAAEEAFSAYALDACIEAINGIGEVTLASKDKIETVEGLYAALDEEQKTKVNNYDVLTAARTTYNDLVKADEFDKAVAACGSTVADYKAVVAKYDALSTSQKALVKTMAQYNTLKVNYVNALIASLPGTITMSDMDTIATAEAIYSQLDDKTAVTNYAKLQSARQALDDILSASKSVSFGYESKKMVINGDKEFFTIVGNPKTSINVEYNGESYTTGLKMESETRITFTLATKMTIILVSDSAGKTVNVDAAKNATVKSDANGVFTITLDAGAHTIYKGDSINIVYIAAIPA